ncbi:hypothetical protein BOO69_03930 [Sulfitobacter alexandrii]|uniref:Calcium-binding protein n=1 Tax=Sulfitobacter alexandrii TaxID=1917485 RepID=A0A1J0WEC0_9RHOB|nr:calcium-binding protein [Sulfitobacter alexandrii]APE42663.1 hypothetical protein BOO69_03930 [Sulfitobacter alexandrii]
MLGLTLLPFLCVGLFLVAFNNDDDDTVETPDPETPDEVVNGTEGDDILAATGSETVNGGAGNDSLTTNAGSVGAVLNGEADNDDLQAEGGNSTLNGGEGDDRLFATDTSDGAVLNGDDGRDDLRAGGTAPTLNGGEGDDSLYNDDAVDAVLNGDGGDDFFGLQTDQDLEGNGGTGNDVFEAFIEGGDVRLNGGEGDDDFIVGGEGGVIHGDAGDDVIYIESAGAEAFGDDGNDDLAVRVVLDAGAADAASTLAGGEGADSFTIELYDPARPADPQDDDLGVVTHISDFDPQEDNLVLDLRGSGSQVNGISTTPSEDGSYLDVTVDVAASATAPAQSFTVRLTGVTALDADQIVIHENARAVA